jgi:hypothetical protein
VAGCGECGDEPSGSGATDYFFFLVWGGVLLEIFEGQNWEPIRSERLTI